MKVKINFLGGVAGNLTGSCTMLTVTEGKKTFRILIDAGLIQCGFSDSIKNNKEILKQLKPSQIDFIILTHSHVDHIGRLPLFVKHGFKGEIICTTGTKKLLKPMLEDSAKIQMVEAAYFNKRLLRSDERSEVKLSFRKHNRAKRKKDKYDDDYFENLYSAKSISSSLNQKRDYVEPLYTNKDIEAMQKLVENDYDYHTWIRLSRFINVKFYHSGHVMGGAVVIVKINLKPKNINFCFSGDLGRRDGIILPPPEIVKEPIDYLFLESTYGGKVHPERDQEIEKLLDLIRKSAVEKRRIIIPSFALERSQEIIYLLSYYMEQNAIPSIPIFLDSPLGSKITSAFADAWYEGMFSDQEKLDFNPFDQKTNPYFSIVSDQESSDALIASTKNYIVIAGSGMCDAGRVRGHLRENLGKSDTTVCLVGYMAKNSLGGHLKDGRSVKMNGEEIKVKAEVVSFDSFSAHADGPFLVDYAKAVLMRNKTSNKTVFLIHGEESSASLLRDDLKLRLSKKVSVKIPKLNEEVTIK